MITMNELKPWYGVATPHEDIRKGRFDEAVYAANIWAVEQGTAPEVYLDPEEFFRKSFMTTGLSTILSRVATALGGSADTGDRIISLQTAFGGGKTHTLVALRHLARHGAKLKKSPHADGLHKVLAGKLPESINVAVFTNASCDVTQGRQTPEGIHTHTLWGELALQLGGAKLYELIRANDEAQRVPQGIFVDILRSAAPCLILLDELADYCVGAAAVPVGNTSLADQTISFIQQLTEAVQQVPGTVVVATLPASKLEVAQSEAGQEAFVTLEKRFQRLGTDIKPIADDEIYEVVRTRLFETVSPSDNPDYPATVAQTYQKMYADHKSDVPSEAAKHAYREQIIRAYPFHPLLIDSLYKRWGSHPDFQRTRGVLRLLGAIVGDLWKRRKGNTQTQHLIQPCHIDWSIDTVQAALTRLWGSTYQSVAAADILGENSNASLFDAERGGHHNNEGIAQGIAAAMMLGSFGGKGTRSGFSNKDLRLACSRHALNWSYTDGALVELEERCFYLHSAAAGNLGKRYWFGTKPNLNKLLVQYRQELSGVNFETDILHDLRTAVTSNRGSEATWRVVVNPEQDLPEQKSLTLIVLPPTLTWSGHSKGENEGDNGTDKVKKHILQMSRYCGRAQARVYRNTLLFLAPTEPHMGRLRGKYLERKALCKVRDDFMSQLDKEQDDDIQRRLAEAKQAVSTALGAAYTVVLKVMPPKEREEVADEVCAYSLKDARVDFSEHLSYMWNTLVEDAEWILRRVGSVTLEEAKLIPVTEQEGIALKDVVEAFLRYTDKLMIATRRAVTTGLEQACFDGLIGIGRGVDPTSLQVRYCGKPISLDPSEEGVWVIPSFQPEAPPIGSGSDPDPDPNPDPDTDPDPDPNPDPDSDPGDLVRSITVRGVVPIENWADLFSSFVGPANNMDLKQLRLGIQFEMETREDKPLSSKDSALQNMEESARQLGLSFDVDSCDDQSSA